MLFGSVAPARAADGRRAPAGFKAASQQLAPGVVHEQFVRQSRIPIVINVARIAPGAPVRLQARLAKGRLGTRSHLQQTSAMCRAINCLIAVNGDFFGSAGQPVGALVSASEMIRSPSRTHHQFEVLNNGTFAAGPAAWTGGIATGDGSQPSGPNIDGVNIDRDANRLVLYTSRYGISTRTNPYGSELVFTVVDPTGPIDLGKPTTIHLEAFRPAAGNSRIPAHGGVLSGHGTAATELQDLWNSIGATDVRLTMNGTRDVRETVGGTPILLRNGARWFSNDRALWRTRAPRTVVGWNSTGELLLVTFDGRQPGYSMGVTLLEAARFMRDLGATDAINLDGGGSSTFVQRGNVVNRPSDLAVRRNGKRIVVRSRRTGDHVLGRVERPVADSIVLVAIPEPGAVSAIERIDPPSIVSTAEKSAPSVAVMLAMLLLVGAAESLRRRVKTARD